MQGLLVALDNAEPAAGVTSTEGSKTYKTTLATVSHSR